MPRTEGAKHEPHSGNGYQLGEAVIPNVAPGTRFTKIAAGSAHNLALKSDGSVIAWGENYAHEATVPSGLNGVVSIVAGSSQFGFEIRRVRVVAWGSNEMAKLYDSGGIERDRWHRSGARSAQPGA